MKKILTFSFCICLAMSAMADNVYKKVLTNLTDWSGTYLILHEFDETDSAVIFNGNLTALDAKNNYIEAPLLKGSDSIRYVAETEEIANATFTITKSATTDGIYYIRSHSGFYIGYNTADAVDANLKSNESKTYDNTIAMTDTSTSVNIFSKNGFVLRYNGDAESLRFRYYAPYKKKGIKLYKLTDISAGIEELNATEKQQNEVYDLMGRKATMLRKGEVYIKKGKKFIVQ